MGSVGRLAALRLLCALVFGITSDEMLFAGRAAEGESYRRRRRFCVGSGPRGRNSSSGGGDGRGCADSRRQRLLLKTTSTTETRSRTLVIEHDLPGLDRETNTLRHTRPVQSIAADLRLAGFVRGAVVPCSRSSRRTGSRAGGLFEQRRVAMAVAMSMANASGSCRVRGRGQKIYPTTFGGRTRSVLSMPFLGAALSSQAEPDHRV